MSHVTVTNEEEYNIKGHNAENEIVSIKIYKKM